MTDQLPYKRKEVIGDCTLYLGDCRDVLPTLGKVDACLTDPPYGIDHGKNGSFQASHGWGDWREKVQWDVCRPEREIFDVILAYSKHQIIWGGNYFTDYLPPSMQWLIWDKAQREFSLADFEIAWSSQKKAARIFEYGRGNEKGFAPRSQEDAAFLRAHPTQKPVALMCWCIDQFPDNVETICDPFFGACSTGVACVKLGRKFIGIEIDEGYFDIACERIRKAYAQPDMFIAPPSEKPKQEALI